MPTQLAGTVVSRPTEAPSHTPRGTALSRLVDNRRASTVFLLPILAVFLVLYVIPLAQTVYFSLTDYKGLATELHFVGLDNYVRVFTDDSLLAGLGFTMLFAFTSTVIITALAIPLAVTLNRRFLGRTLARTLFFFVGVPSMAILGLVWQFIFSPLESGALNSVLADLGFEAVPWLADSNIARACVIFVAVWAQVGWHATLYLAYLQSIPADLYEQAAVDGASGPRLFWHITLPELVPAIVVSSFLLITHGLKVFDLPFAMTSGGPGYATNTITQSIVVQGLSQANYGVGSALAVVFTVGCVAVIVLQMYVARLVGRRFA